MYKRNAQGWSKHIDFMLLDIFILQASFVIAYYLRHQGWVYSRQEYRNLGLLLFAADVLVTVVNNSLHDVIKRGYAKEAFELIKHSIYVLAIVLIYFFSSQLGGVYSRITLAVTFALYVIFGYITRIIWKYILRHTRFRRERNNMLVVASEENADGILTKLLSDNQAGYSIVGVVILETTNLKSVHGIPVVSDMKNAANYIAKEWIDSVYIDGPINDKRIVKLMDACAVMAVPTHYHVPHMARTEVKRFSEKIGGTAVLTTAINYATPVQILIKRLFDIVAGLIGSVCALLIMAIVGPIIKIQSPGPVLFKQERIGKNGKHIKIYKIRSMRMDAEDMKKDLMDQNLVKDGMMFKMDFDPRIIGNKILPDGTRKTGIGEFIRRTSLDEFPQFFNVLGGSMSTVGTRPPTPDEYEKYHFHHRARLAVKPGITGMWQVSGRSEITDFEEVVKLDTGYVANWSLGLDAMIIFKTIKVIFSRKGAM
ncbi:MAG: sugar transferase [Clostridiales bacterium]|nr:sugar transferase [Clostridiales bacterium]MBR3248039.1 sugar transferase [Clostridiales bacterium]